MKKKGLTIWVFIVVTVLSGVVNAASDEKQKQRSITAPKDRLQDIEKYISQSRKRTEDYYARRMKELKLRAEEEIKLFEEAEQSKLAKAELVKKARHFEDWGFVPSGTLLSNEEVALVESRTSEKKKEIMESLERSAAAVERQKTYALTVGLMKLEERLKENVLKPKPEPTYGVVTGIIFSQEEPSAAIAGKIVHEGDVIQDVKVVKIHRDNVQFEKDGNVWKQKVGQTAEVFWPPMKLE